MRVSLSTLTGDCLLNVFSFLDLKDLGSISYADHRMRELAQTQMERSKKQRRIRLRIVQIANSGYAFNLFRGYKLHEENYFYGVNADGSEAVRVKYTGELNDKYHNVLLYKGGYYVQNDLPIPSSFIDELDKLLQWHSLGGLALRNIRITSSVMDFLEQTVRDVNRLEFFGCKVDDDCFERLSDFILQQQVLSLKFRNSDLLLNFIPNEHFLERLSKDKTKKLDLIVQPSIAIAKQCRFTPSKDVMNYLTTFESVDFQSLILDVQWIPELLEKLLRRRQTGQMIVGVTARPLTWDFTPFPRLRLFRIRKSRDFDHGVENRSVGSSVRFKAYQKGNGFVLRADFEMDDRWS